MKLPAYPRTKPSGVEWLGDVPEHWEVKRLRRVLAKALQYGANESAELDDPDLPRYVRITDVHENGTLRPETFRSLPKDIAAPYLLKDGDLLFARSGATSGKTFLYQNSWGICAYAGYLIRARMNQQKAIPAFVKYFTTSTNYWQWLSSVFIQSTIQNVSAEKYADLHLSLPPPAEQRSIAAFLDRETGRVDRLVAKKRELIERLKEKRTALISRTVTRGLPPAAAKAAGLPANPPLKSSGLDWLGDIPAHWEVKRLSYLAVLKSGENITSEMIAEGGDYPVYGGNGFRGNYHKFTHRGQYVLIGRQGALCGNINYASGEFWASEHALVVLPLKKFAVVWMGELLKSMNLGQYSVTAAQPGIAAEVIRGLRIPVPPLPEQAAIAAYLDLETAKLDALVGKVAEAVERLQEYRTALITAAVTGKIDVRKANA